MKGCLLFILCIVLGAGNCYSQHTFYRVHLKDKNETSFSLSSPLAYLSTKAINRRLKQYIAIDSSDLPVNATYTDRIRTSGNVTIHGESKWFNTVCIETEDALALEKIRSFAFVSDVILLTGSSRQAIDKNATTITGAAPPVTPHVSIMGTLGFDYGNSFNQIHIHQGEYLHDLGFRGEGMSIAVIDAGFYQYKTNPVFDSLRMQNRVLGEYDFVFKENSVNEDNDHGMHCLSILAANKPGELVGSAPKAGYYLLKTEDVASETPLEEDNWAAAAEYADSAGADMISSSLGYINFDNPAFNHSYAQRDGNTALITKAADLAAKKGILVMNAAGNDGKKTTDNKYVTCPADGDSVFAVGSVDVNLIITPLSSWGPNASGKIKPEVVSMGSNTAVAEPNGNVSFGSGTSYACPNLAGLVACLWQAFPEFNNMEIIDAVKRSANKYNSPDERFGYGVPDFRKAYAILLQLRAVENARRILGGSNIKAYPIPFSDLINVVIKAEASGNASLRLTDVAGKLIALKKTDVQKDAFYTITFTNLETLSRGIYIIQYVNNGYKNSLRLVK